MQRERLVGVEPGEEDDGCPDPQRDVHHGGLPEGVEQRQPAEHDVVGPQVERVDERGCAPARRWRGASRRRPSGCRWCRSCTGWWRHPAARPPRGRTIGAADAASASRRGRSTPRVGRQQHGHQRHAGGRGRGHGLAQQRRGGDEHVGAGVAQHVRDLVRLEEQVHRHDDRAERQGGVVDAGEVGHVRHEHRDPVAAADAARAQRAGVGAGLVPELTVRGRRAGEVERGAIRVADGGLGEDARDRQRREAGAVDGGVGAVVGHVVSFDVRCRESMGRSGVSRAAARDRGRRGAPRRDRRRCAATGRRRTARRAAVSDETPAPPCTWMARSMICCTARGTAILIAWISVIACLLPTVSMSHAVLSTSRRSASSWMRDSATHSRTTPCSASVRPNACRARRALDA